MSKIFGMLDEIIPKIFRTVAFIAGLSVMVMMVAVLREIFGRYFFSAPTAWSIELSEHLMVVFTFLGGPFVMLMNAHVRADVVYRYFTGKKKAFMDVLIYSLSMVYLIVLTWRCSLYSFQLLATWARSSGGLMLPLFPTQVTVTLGALLTCVECLRKLIHAAIELYRKKE